MMTILMPCVLFSGCSSDMVDFGKLNDHSTESVSIPYKISKDEAIGMAAKVLGKKDFSRHRIKFSYL